MIDVLCFLNHVCINVLLEALRQNYGMNMLCFLGHVCMMCCLKLLDGTMLVMTKYGFDMLLMCMRNIELCCI